MARCGCGFDKTTGLKVSSCRSHSRIKLGSRGMRPDQSTERRKAAGRRKNKGTRGR